jgi:hypothetical protein
MTGSKRRNLHCRWVLWLIGMAGGLSLLAHRGIASQPAPLMKDFIGINGHTVQFKPGLYRPVCRLVRDYHPVEWDLGKITSELPPFPAAKNGVDWSLVYGSWHSRGWVIDASLMFESVPRENWKDLEPDAKAYGLAFAREFGPSGPHPLVDSVEIGNEPGKWSDSDYARMFKAMAQGLRAGDAKLQIVTCNVTTGKSGDYEKSVACLEQSAGLYDVLNVHSYAQLVGWPTWRRSYPEDPRLPHYLQDVENLCHWRDIHAPSKPVWITEFGYDSSTHPADKTGDFKDWVGVSDEQQAQWLVRSLLVFSSLSVERAYIYFFNDEDQPRLHASSGITRNFHLKPSFYALQHLQRILGEYRFDRMITNAPGILRVQQYRGSGNRLIWTAWSPTGEGKSVTTPFDHLPGHLERIEKMPLTNGDVTSRPPPDVTQRTGIQLVIGESPTYLIFSDAPGD